MTMRKPKLTQGERRGLVSGPGRSACSALGGHNLDRCRVVGEIICADRNLRLLLRSGPRLLRTQG